MNNYMNPMLFAGLNPQAQMTVRHKTCFDRGELDVVAKSICDECNVSYEEFRGRLKTNELSDARKIFYYLCRIRLYTFTCRRLGEYTGGRDHSTVTFAVQRCSDFLDVDPDFKELYRRCLITTTQQLKLQGYEYRS